MERSVLPLILVLCLCISFIALSTAQQTRCFHYTWLGPRWNNESVFLNATCSDATKLSKGVPCAEPLVVSYDGTWPDVDYIWTHHRNASCILADNDICASYTYYFNGHVENSTHFCSRAVDTDGGAITGGCYNQVNGSSTTRVCLCRSVPGGVPCNTGEHQSITNIIVLLASSITAASYKRLFCVPYCLYFIISDSVGIL